jgi:hypothetical protein
MRPPRAQPSPPCTGPPPRAQPAVRDFQAATHIRELTFADVAEPQLTFAEDAERNADKAFRQTS